jgi:hypothetical protein
MGRATVLAVTAMRLSRRVLLCWGALGMLAAGCLSPTLPLPPPSPPDVAKIGEGQYELRGSIPVRGAVIVVDTRTGVIGGRTDVTVYDFVMSARPDDAMLVWYEAGGDTSEAVPFRIDRDPEIPDAGVPPSPPPTDAGKD